MKVARLFYYSNMDEQDAQDFYPVYPVHPGKF